MTFFLPMRETHVPMSFIERSMMFSSAVVLDTRPRQGRPLFFRGARTTLFQTFVVLLLDNNVVKNATRVFVRLRNEEERSIPQSSFEGERPKAFLSIQNARIFIPNPSLSFGGNPHH